MEVSRPVTFDCPKCGTPRHVAFGEAIPGVIECVKCGHAWESEQRSAFVERKIEKVYEARLGAGTGTNGFGFAVGYTAEPTFVLQMDDGSTLSWVASLCREATPEEAVVYWRKRALAAEALVDRVARGGGSLELRT